MKKTNIRKNTKKNSSQEKTFTTLEVVILIIITVTISLAIGCLVTYNLNKHSYSALTDEKKEILKQYDYIVENYYTKVDTKKISSGAVQGMLASLDDDYSYLIDEETSDNFDIELEGEYKGIGIEIVTDKNNNVVINYVFENSPSKKAGLKVGDIITEIDGEKLTDKNSTDVANYIRKNSKDKIKIKIIRNNETKTFTVDKGQVTIKSVASKTFKQNDKLIGYIYIEIFSNNAYQQFKTELEKLEKQNIDALIIDVREDSGGHLSTASKILSLFLDRKHVIYQTNTKGKIEKFYSSGSKTKKYPIAILQNHNSASASELLSAALKEEYGAIVVGENSFGKGTVQELNNINKDIEFKMTIKEWLTPKGNSVNKKGVAPDYEVKLSKDYYENPKEENDNQLQEAIKQISKK